MKYLVQCQVDVVVDVNERNAIDRCVENQDDEGRPQPLGRDQGERGWQDVYYDLDEEEDVLRHLAFNAVANGVTYASRLDGWADLQPDDVTMQVDRRSFDAVFITPL